MNDAPTVNRYLKALGQMVEDLSLDNRIFARRCWRDLGEPGMCAYEYLEHVITLPLGQLSPEERRLRMLAEKSPLAGFPVAVPPVGRLVDGVVLIA